MQISPDTHKQTHRYDDLGKEIEDAFFDKNDKPINGKAGYHKITKSYDLRGNQTEIAYFDVDGRSVAGSDNYARMTIAHDGRDNITEWAYYDADRHLTDRGEGYAILRQQYDDQDRVTEMAYYDSNDRLTKGPDGYAIARSQYNGNSKDERHYDTADNSIAPDGCQITRADSDPRTGKETQLTCLDAQGHPTASNSGATVVRMKYDDHGDQTELADLSEDGKPQSPKGWDYAIVRKKYDEHGNMIEQAYFGEDGKLRFGPDGYAMTRMKYDEDGHEVEQAWYDVEERLHSAPNLADIRQGTFIGTATATQPDSTLRSVEVVVFPESMKGTAEGHYPWDLPGSSMMTNATVSNAVKGVDGQTVTVTYKGGEKKIDIPANVPVVALVPSSAADIQAGQAVFVPGQRQADGSIHAGAVLFGKDGLVPPM